MVRIWNSLGYAVVKLEAHLGEQKVDVVIEAEHDTRSTGMV